MANNQKTYDKIDYAKDRIFTEIALFVFSDLLLLSAAYELSVFIRRLLIPIMGGEIITNLSNSLLGMLLISNFVLIAVKGNYPGRGTIAVIELRNIVEAISTAYFLIGGVIFLTTPTSNYSRSIFLISWFLSCMFVPLGRFTIRKVASLQKWWGEPIAIIGTNQEIGYLYRDVKKCRRLGFRPIVGLYLPSNEKLKKFSNLPFYPLSSEILEHLNERGIKTVLVTLPPKEFRRENPHLFRAIEKNFIRSIFILDDLSFGFLWGKPVDIEGRPGFQMQHNLLNPITSRIKDFVDSILTIILIIPILIMIAMLSILIWIDSPGNVFYTQERIGINKKIFRIIKFRTMVPDADHLLPELLRKNLTLKREYEKYHKLENDPRITSVGKWLRRFSLDELPQIFNILKGEMSFIGPRAYMREELSKMGNDGELIFRVRPALTGWWQVMGRNETSFQNRIRLDVYYINNWSLWMDLYIFIKTFWVMITGKGR
jgi:Undecaprenyl-phosphate galactose phosphotransferase WbaP